MFTTAEYAPWIITDIQMPDGSPLTWEALEAQSQTNLLSLSASISETYAQQQGAVSEFVQTNLMGLPAWWMDTNGDVFFIDSIDASGARQSKQLSNTESANTVSADKLWPGGSSGFQSYGNQYQNRPVGRRRRGAQPPGVFDQRLPGVSSWTVSARSASPTMQRTWREQSLHGECPTPPKGFSNRGTVLESDYINDQG